MLGRLVVTCSCVLALAAPSAQAQTNGQIAFEREGNGIWVVNPDGSGQAPLIPGGSMPAWSPDGQRLTFVMDHDIWIANADGTGRTRITHDAVDDADPAWAPDGRRLAFAAGGEIFVMNADGGDRTQITGNDVVDAHPAWSPDGTRIAFDRQRAPGHDDAGIWVMSPDGSGQARITNDDANHANPDWSPDGRRIAFAVELHEGLPITFHDAVAVMNTDGSGMRTFDALGFSPAPSWSPDGQQIAWGALHLSTPSDRDIAVVNQDGSAPTRLTEGNADDRDQDWGTHPPTVAPPATPAPPRDTAGPSVAISRRAVRATRRRVVAVRLRCPAGEPAGCAGTLTLRSAARVRRRVVKLGSARFRIGAGRTETVRVRLSRSKLRLLRRRGRLRVAATVRATDQVGNARTTRARFLLRAPRRR